MRFLSTFFLIVFVFNFSLAQDDVKVVNPAKKATNLACIIPGSGHLYNNQNRPENTHSRVWWKLPIIYGGLAASGYFTYFNQNEFKLIRNERLSRLSNPPSALIITVLSGLPVVAQSLVLPAPEPPLTSSFR